jgi:hypothetical protein
MIYTCYDMVRDCREDRAEGWRFLVTNYAPIIRKFVDHYGPPPAPSVESILTSLKHPESSLFASLEPTPERWFLGEVRQRILAGLDFPSPEIDLDLETVATALAPLTVTEKLAAWTEGMGYTSEQAGAMLRMAPATVAKIRDRASDLIRGQVDTWRRTLLQENGPQLGRAAAAVTTPDCLGVKVFLDVLDGRMPWSGREQMERHVTVCFHCVDHFCRMAEVIELLRGVRPLSEEEAAPYYRVLGIEPKEKRGWRRLLRTKSHS